MLLFLLFVGHVCIVISTFSHPIPFPCLDFSQKRFLSSHHPTPLTSVVYSVSFPDPYIFNKAGVGGGLFFLGGGVGVG